jgi:hypothetical protein
MKKYIVLETQQGGCDYTIGCGKNWEFVDANSMKEAIEVYLKDEDSESGIKELGEEGCADSFEVYELGEGAGESICMAVQKLAIINAKRKTDEERVKRQEEDEKAMYEKLKIKFK